MKELSIEEKTKAYDGNYKAYTELINRLEDVKEAIKKHNYGIAMDILCKPYPEFQITTSTELKKSEDERIKKMLRDVISQWRTGNQAWCSDAKLIDATLAWLEKQGEQSDANKEYWRGYREGKQEILDKYVTLEKQGEHRSYNKVEPKFKVKYAGSEYNVLEVKDIAGVTYYEIEDEPNHIDYILPDNCEIVGGYSIKENGSPYSTKPTKFSEQKPANKIEPDILIEESYQQQADDLIDMVTEKSSWSEEDESWFKELELMALSFSNDDSYRREFFDWLKSLIDRVQPQPKQEWSEEDERLFQIIIDILDREEHLGHISHTDLIACVRKLKSLKDRVQPMQEWSEEDETTKNNISHIIRQYDKISKRENQPCYYVGDCLLWMQNIKDRVQPQPKQEWSEEERQIIEDAACFILSCVNTAETEKEEKRLEELADKLQDLRPQNAWKPSDEQMKVVYVVTRCEEHSDYVEEVFLDESKAKEYCKQFEGNEDAYARHITKMEVTL